MSDSRLLKEIVIVSVITVMAGTVTAPLAHAQAARATIQGTVTDATGAVLTGAAVEVVNVATGVSLSLSTNEVGRYSAPDLALGDYDLRASLSGFQSVVRQGVTLQVGTHIAVDFELPPGRIEETVIVTRPVPVIETRSSAVGALITQQQLLDLPLNGRSVLQLIAMAPGVIEMPFGAAGGGALFGRQNNFAVSGARADGQAFLLDNTNIQGFWNRGAGSGALGTMLGLDALAEFQVLTNTYGAQFGGSGAVVNAITRSGANQVHGSAFEYFRNSRMDSRNFFDVLGKQPFERHQFGARIGGPLRQNRAFYFFNYEGIQQHQVGTRIASVPDLAARNGMVGGVTVGVSPAIKPILDLYPLPTSTLGGGVGQVPQVASSDGHENFVVARLDYVFSASSAVFGRYVSDTAKVFDPWSGSDIPKWGAQSKTNNQYLTIEERSVLNASLINQVRFGLVRDRETSRTMGDTAPLDFFPGEGRQNGVIQVASLTNIGGSIVLPVDLAVDRISVAEDVYWNRGNHSLKLGGSIEWTRAMMDVPFLAGGVWVFTSVTGLLVNSPLTVVGALAGADDARRETRELSAVGYLQDDWGVSRRLTLNLGLRYNPTAIPIIDGRAGATTLKDPPNSPFESVARVFASNPSWGNLDPRIGFAFVPSADEKTSLRGGFGVFHNPIAPRIVLPYYVNNPPYRTGQRFFFPLTPVTSTFPVPFAGAGASPPLSVSQGLDYNTDKTPYLMQWNINVQREVWDETGIAVAYVASRGENMLRQRDVNPITPRTLADGTVVFGVPNPAVPAIVSNPAVNPSYSRLTINYADGWSQYHALQVSAHRRLHRGVQAQLAYTLSKCIDQSSGSFGGEGSTPATNPYDPDYDQGPCYFDRTHVLNANAIWELPFSANGLASGWVVTAVVRASSGRPFTPSIGFSQSGLQGQAPERPNLAPGMHLADAYTGSYQRWFDPTVFVLPRPGTLGSVGRHSLRAPPQNTVDCAVIKNVAIGKATMEWRLEIFNVFNHVNFGLPNANIFVQTVNGGGGYSPTAGQITQAGPARQVQLAARVTF